MRHRKKGKILGRPKAAREALFRNLAESIILYEKVKTTEAKAKAVRPLVEKMITTGKHNTLTSKRKLAKFFYTENAIKKIIEDLGPKYKERKGGYTRIIKTGTRKGDGAEMVVIELV